MAVTLGPWHTRVLHTESYRIYLTTRWRCPQSIWSGVEVTNFPGPSVGFEESADSLPDTTGELRELSAGVCNDL